MAPDDDGPGLADVPTNVYWIAGYTGPGDPRDAPRRTWAQLIVTTAGSAELTRRAAQQIVAKTRADPADLTILGPYTDPGAAGRAQWEWLAQQPTTPARSYVTVTVETQSGQPPHPIAVQQAARHLAPWQTTLELGDESPTITATLAIVSPQIGAAADAAGAVTSAFGAAEEPVEFLSMTIDSPRAFHARLTTRQESTH